MTRASRKSRLIASTVLVCTSLILIAGPLEADDQKSYIIPFLLFGDRTSDLVTVTYSHEGARQDAGICLDSLSGQATSFVLGVGERDSLTSALCTGVQLAAWNIQGQTVLIGPDVHTEIVRANTPAPTCMTDALVCASPVGPGGVSESRATTVVIFSSPDIGPVTGQSMVDKIMALDDATITGADRTYGLVFGSTQIRSNGTALVEFEATLTTNGAPASVIVTTGITLPDGLGTQGSFTSTVVHSQDPAQNFVFDVSVQDGVLSGPDSGLPGWVLTANGWFLSVNDFPWPDDMTFTLTANAPYEIIVTGTVEDLRGTPAVGVPTFSALPRGFVLEQNVPNPFNPMTKITFELAAPGHAQVRVYDMSGRLVRNLLDTALGKGYHVLPWNGVNDAGQTVSSGIYFYRLVFNGNVETRKMVLLK